MPAYAVGNPSVLAFIVIPVVLAAVFVWAVSVSWRADGASREAASRAAVIAAAGVALWMALTWVAAAAGILRRWDLTPPPFAALVAAILALAFGIAFSPAGRRLAALPLWALVGIQGFRLPLELAMHSLYERGIMPQQMSYSGRNFDILTGISAIVVAALLARGIAGRRTALAWNVGGLLLLANIVVVAILSTPRFAYFGPDRLNVFVVYPPFVWLPAILVLAALLGHLLVFRALRAGGPVVRLISQQV